MRARLLSGGALPAHVAAPGAVSRVHNGRDHAAAVRDLLAGPRRLTPAEEAAATAWGLSLSQTLEQANKLLRQAHYDPSPLERVAAIELCKGLLDDIKGRVDGLATVSLDEQGRFEAQLAECEAKERAAGNYERAEQVALLGLAFGAAALAMAAD